MTIESKRVTLVRMAAEAGLGQYLPAEPGLPGTWWGTDLERLQRFAELVLADFMARTPPPIVLNTADLDPELLRQMLTKATAMPLVPVPAPDVAQAVAAEREACARVASAWDCELALGIADAIRARGAA